MAVLLRVTGTWAELTADGAVAIPATPQAGDRMYLFARWKDFSITATVVDWTEIAEFADGILDAGNGTGSVKVACWYRDWESGDTDPTIDFSASPSNASVVIMVMQKAADEVWETPIAVTAAMTNWTTTSQIVAASSTAVVKGEGVVMGLIGLRDDSATMTRPTTGIDDSAGAITWNGNYVESPATHHSTTTGFDGAADLGYRLVTTGATATLRMTGTISAAETGAALWVVQNVSTVVIPTTVALTTTEFAPKLDFSTIPTTATLVTASFAPKLALTLTPSTPALTITSFAPALNLVAIPSTSVLVLTTFAPKLHEQITPITISLSVTAFAPTASVLLTVIPATASLTITLQNALLSYDFIPASASLVISFFRPSILPFNIVWLDPGGDAVQAVGYFNTLLSGSTGVSFDTSQKVVGVGSYKFDSLTGVEGQQGVQAPAGVMGTARRVSCYLRYDSVPDKTTVTTLSVSSRVVYSGGGFGTDVGIDGDVYIATPAKNAGQGSVFDSLGFDDEIPIGIAIDSVKIIYEHKYDIDTSIGISRVKYRINGIEGPNYDNTDMPLTDTEVTVDLTADRGFTREDLLDGVFEVIAEARRGDTDTEHTQSWDYIKVEVVWHFDGIIEAKDSINEAGFKIGLSRNGTGATLRFIDNDGDSYLGITQLAVDTQHRISFGYRQTGANDLSINIYVNSILELSISEANATASPMFNFRYGWLDNPGANHLCWFDQIYIDDGDDLSDPVFGAEFHPPLCTAKLPATVNENNWNTTVGTGAVNERPLSITNHMKETGTSGARQSYTLQAASVGDIDISAETLLGHMGWAWAKATNNSSVEEVALIVNGVNADRTSAIIQWANNTPLLLKSPETSSSYPSDAAGIGMTGNIDSADIFLYECGDVVAYLGPAEESILPYQPLAEDSITNLTDDLRADPPNSYELCYRIDESEANVLITIYSISAEDQPPQLQGVAGGQGGTGRTRITPGIEVQITVEVTGGSTSVAIWHRLNVD